MPTCHKTCKACGGRATFVSRKYTEHALHWRTLSGCTEGRISARSEMEQSAPTRQVKKESNAEITHPAVHICSPPEKRTQPRPIRSDCLTPYLWRCIQSCMKTRKSVVPLPNRKRGTASAPAKHRHDWYKSLAGGLRCKCEVWRCEFGADSNQCDSAAGHGSKYCPEHLTAKPQ